MPSELYDRGRQINERSLSDAGASEQRVIIGVNGSRINLKKNFIEAMISEQKEVHRPG